MTVTSTTLPRTGAERAPAHPGPLGRAAGTLWRAALAHPRAAVATLCVLGLVVRVVAVGATNLWLDEANSWFVATHPLGTVLLHIQRIPGAAFHAPLYFVLLKGWMAVSGDSEAALRLLSVAFGVALLPVTYAIGERVLGREVALLATLLLTLSPLQVYFSQEVRMYMLLALLCAATVLAHLSWWEPRGHDRGRAPALIAYVACAILALYTHYGAALILLALNLDAAVRLLAPARARGLRALASRELLAWALAQAAIAAAFLPFFLSIDRAAAAESQGWRSPLGLAGALREMFQFLLASIDGVYYYANELIPVLGYARQRPVLDPANWRLLEMIVALPLVLVALVGALAHAPGLRRARLLYLCTTLPLAAGVVVSIHAGLEFTRYFLFTTPFLALLVAGGLLRMPARTRAPALAVLLAASALGLVRTWHVTNRDSDYRPVGRLLSRAARPEEPILLVPPDNGVSLYYYLRDTRMRWESVRDPSQLTGRLATAPGSRAWVVVDYRSPLYRLSPAGLRDMLGAEPTLQRRFDAGGASGVMLLQVPAGIARPARREGEGLPPRPPPAGTH